MTSASPREDGEPTILAALVATAIAAGDRDALAQLVASDGAATSDPYEQGRRHGVLDVARRALDTAFVSPASAASPGAGEHQAKHQGGGYDRAVAISSYLRSVRAKVGNDLLVLPSAAVLPLDGENRLLLVENADTRQWQTLGGAIEPDESPREAAVREASEEAGVTVELVRLLDVLGGPEYRVGYPKRRPRVLRRVGVLGARRRRHTISRRRGDLSSGLVALRRARDELETIPCSRLTVALLDAVSAKLAAPGGREP